MSTALNKRGKGTPTTHPSKTSLRGYAQKASIWFLEKHLIFAKKELNGVDHIVIYMNGMLMLLQRDDKSKHILCEESNTPAMDDPYLLLKITCHFSISLFEILEQAIQRHIRLEDLPEELDELYEQIETLHTNFSNLDVVMPTIDLMLSYLKEISRCTQVNQLELIRKRYLRDLKPNIDKYTEMAAELQLKGLQQIYISWNQKYLIDLMKTYIIIVGARGPKKDLIEHQFFNALRAYYGIDEKNTPFGGIIYSEMLPQQMKDLTIEMLIDDLARDLHNMQIGLGMLNDRHAMYQDVLGKYAPRVIKELIETPLPQQEGKCPFRKITNNAYKFFPYAKDATEGENPDTLNQCAHN
ncbi:hypothetical protein [Legionella sp. PC997]|uniref:hypothetical protein n=1 Tax=Legionella sp. PC997 TaxID=2755562 RepID=UPI0015F97F23|nr:hypothetical protein [Legionella sp. PC997]